MTELVIYYISVLFIELTNNSFLTFSLWRQFIVISITLLFYLQLPLVWDFTGFLPPFLTYGYLFSDNNCKTD